MTEYDPWFMDLALRLGRRGMGATGANPAVGCVLVRDDGPTPMIVGRGWTGAGGRPHAETVALHAAGDAARGAVAYVSLEPCAHHGKTPPCADALIGAGVARVVVAIEDPDPRVSGRGLAMLAEAGTTVDLGLRAPEARRDLAGFLSRVETGRPHVTLKLAVSRDDKIAMSADAPTRITGEEALARSHLLRAVNDAILVGVGTALADDPRLTCRLPCMEDRTPVRVVLDTTLRLDAGSRLAMSTGEGPVLVFCASRADGAKRAVLEASGVEVAVVPHGAAGGLDPGAVLSGLGDRGVGRLLVEGGASVAATFVREDLVDELVLFRAPHEIGPGGVDALAGLALSDIVAGGRFALWQSLECGEDVMLHYGRAGQGPCSQA